MSEVSRRVGATCPSCSPDVPTEHEVLSDGGQWTVRCVDCGHVHVTTVDDSSVEVDVVVSQDGESFAATVEPPPDEPLSTGDEFVVEGDPGVFTVRVTSLELPDGSRTDDAQASEVRTIWTRDVGNVAVDATVHPPAGAGDREQSRSVTLHVPGDYEFVVGETESAGDERFRVEGIQIRDAAPDYRFDKFDHDGDVALAKDCKRLYGRSLGADRGPWAPW